MRRLLLTCDWHLSENPRDAYRFAAAEQILQTAIAHKVDAVFILGDLTDFPDHHSASFTNRVVELLRRAATSCSVHIIRGNHDCVDPAVPFFRFINAIDRCSFLTEVTPWEAEGTRILLVPNGCWPQPLPDGYHMVFAHETFTGAKSEHDHLLKGLRLPLSPIPIFSGDVHVPQRQGTVTYIGAPTLIRFGDSYKPRVLLLDLNAGCEPVVRAMPIVGPSKKLVEGHVHADGAIDWHNIETLIKGDLVKVRLTFEDTIPSLAHLRANVVKDIDAASATLHSIDVGNTVKDTATPRTPVSRSDTDLVRQYATARSLTQPVVEAGLAIVESKP